MNEHLQALKPSSPDAPREGAVPGSGGETSRMHRQILVLLVDDQALVGESVRRMLLPEEGIAFHYCSHAGEALLLARELRPTVILQDLVMPELDGLTLVRHYRGDPATRDIPIIVLLFVRTLGPRRRPSPQEQTTIW